MKINTVQFNTEIWKEGKMYVAYAPQLDISSCGKTAVVAKKNIQEAAALFFEETRKLGTLNQILKEAGFSFKKSKEWQAPELISFERMQLAL